MSRRNKRPVNESKGRKTDEQRKLDDWKRRRDRLFRDPTEDGIRAFLRDQGIEPPTDNIVLWAAFHKARTSWRPASNNLALRQNSLEWLLRHGMKPGD